MKRRILKPIAAVTTALAMITGCFLDSVSWAPTITTGILIIITMILVVIIDPDDDEEEQDNDLHGL